MQIDKLIDRIRRFAKRKKLTKTELAREAGLADNTLRHLWDDNFSPNATTLRKLERFMQNG